MTTPGKTAESKKATLAMNEKGEKVIRITFPFTYDTLHQVRTLVGREYHKEQRCWSAPIHERNLKRLIEWNFSIDPLLLEYLHTHVKKLFQLSTNGIAGFKGTLYPFQNEGVAFLEARNGKALIADEMGLGKTIQALAWLQMHPELRPVLIVVPASLKLNWKKEAERWMESPDVELLYGTTPWDPKGELLIINYDIITYWADKLRELDIQGIVFDEVHYIKSNKANRTKSAKLLAKGTPVLIGLSGTPIVNRPIESYNFLHMIAPDIFQNRWSFAQRYCALHHNGFGMNMNGASNTEELHRILVGSVMLRRMKVDVQKDLPNKIYSFVPMELRNQREYDMAERDFIQFIRLTRGKDAAIKASNAEQLVKIEALKQIAVQGKIDQVINWIQDALDSNGKLVVFAWHTAIIEKLISCFGEIAVRYDGTMSGVKKEEAKEQFQNNPDIRLFVGNIKAAGVGITLTAASNVAFIELPWTPGDLDQCIDRLHRIGQKDTVNVYYLLAEGTIEEKIAKIIDTKRQVFNAVLDGRITEQESLLTELINSYI
jgi:SNF2 family DNA or RNA helicase